MAKATCMRECWDSKATKFYFIGEMAEIDPKHPLAKYFEFQDPTVKAEPVKKIEPEVVVEIQEEAKGKGLKLK